MKKATLILATLALLISLSCTQESPVDVSKSIELNSIKSTSENVTVIFGPQVYTRERGKPKTEEIMIESPGSPNNYFLIIENGGDEKNSQVTSCFVVLDDDTLICPIDITKDTDLIEKEIELTGENLLSIRLDGKPGSYITVSIIMEEPPCPCCTVTDIDGNTYNAVQIGTQCWMVENLKVTHYRNGDSIPNLVSNSDWISTSNGAYCIYENNIDNIAIYGLLYNWYVVTDNREIAPEGWHIPTDDDWKQLEMFLGMSQNEADATGYRGTDVGGKLKETGTEFWTSPNKGATNESGFTSLGSASRNYTDGEFSTLYNNALYWTSSESASDTAWYRRLSYLFSTVYREDYAHKKYGFSIRCVKDN